MAYQRKEYNDKITSGETVNIDTLDRNDDKYQYTITYIIFGTDGSQATASINNGPEMTLPSGTSFMFNIHTVSVSSGEVVVYGDKNRNPIDFY